jgi:hypothetical protein
VNRSKFTEQEAVDGTCTEFKSYVVGMQVSCGVDTEISEKDLIWAVAELYGLTI